MRKGEIDSKLARTTRLDTVPKVWLDCSETTHTPFAIAIPFQTPNQLSRIHVLVSSNQLYEVKSSQVKFNHIEISPTQQSHQEVYILSTTRLKYPHTMYLKLHNTQMHARTLKLPRHAPTPTINAIQ